jgi:hypothetical protein
VLIERQHFRFVTPKRKANTPSRQIDNIVIEGGEDINRGLFDNTKFTYWTGRVDKAAANKSV